VREDSKAWGGELQELEEDLHDDRDCVMAEVRVLTRISKRYHHGMLSEIDTNLMVVSRKDEELLAEFDLHETGEGQENVRPRNIRQGG